MSNVSKKSYSYLNPWFCQCNRCQPSMRGMKIGPRVYQLCAACDKVILHNVITEKEEKIKGS